MAERPLAGKVAWVTGSGRGLGRAAADELARLGADVAVHGTGQFSTRALGEADSLDAVAEAIAAEHGVRTVAVWGDLADEAVVNQCLEKVHAALGPVDILVNFAGGDIGSQGVSGPLAGKPVGNDAINISVQDIRTVLDRNVMTCILCCRAVAPEMMERKAGHIVNVGSVAGLAGHVGEAIYGASKAAVHEYTRCLAAMMRPYNVYVNAVAPGPILSARFLASRPIDEAMKVEDGTLERYGWPKEIATVVAFLVTDASSYIHGQVLRIDGGRQLSPA